MIDPNRVDEVFRDCLFRPGEAPPMIEHYSEAPEGCVLVVGVRVNCGFHIGRVEQHRAEIASMIEQLPEPFFAEGEKGGGWSFLMGCQLRNGEQWTGLQERVDQLFMLGQAIDRVRCLLPRPLWSALPGGVPYFVILPESAPVGAVIQ